MQVQKDILEYETAPHSSILAWKIHGQINLAGYSPLGRKDLDTTEWQSTHTVRYNVHTLKFTFPVFWQIPGVLFLPLVSLSLNEVLLLLDQCDDIQDKFLAILCLFFDYKLIALKRKGVEKHFVSGNKKQDV